MKIIFSKTNITPSFCFQIEPSHDVIIVTERDKPTIETLDQTDRTNHSTTFETRNLSTYPLSYQINLLRILSQKEGDFDGSHNIADALNLQKLKSNEFLQRAEQSGNFQEIIQNVSDSALSLFIHQFRSEAFELFTDKINQNTYRVNFYGSAYLNRNKGLVHLLPPSQQWVEIGGQIHSQAWVARGQQEEPMMGLRNLHPPADIPYTPIYDESQGQPFTQFTLHNSLQEAARSINVTPETLQQWRGKVPLPTETEALDYYRYLHSQESAEHFFTQINQRENGQLSLADIINQNPVSRETENLITGVRDQILELRYKSQSPAEKITQLHRILERFRAQLREAFAQNPEEREAITKISDFFAQHEAQFYRAMIPENIDKRGIQDPFGSLNITVRITNQSQLFTRIAQTSEANIAYTQGLEAQQKLELAQQQQLLDTIYYHPEFLGLLKSFPEIATFTQVNTFGNVQNIQTFLLQVKDQPHISISTRAWINQSIADINQSQNTQSRLVKEVLMAQEAAAAHEIRSRTLQNDQAALTIYLNDPETFIQITNKIIQKQREASAAQANAAKTTENNKSESLKDISSKTFNYFTSQEVQNLPEEAKTMITDFSFDMPTNVEITGFSSEGFTFGVGEQLDEPIFVSFETGKMSAPGIKDTTMKSFLEFDATATNLPAVQIMTRIKERHWFMFHQRNQETSIRSLEKGRFDRFFHNLYPFNKVLQKDELEGWEQAMMHYDSFPEFLAAFKYNEPDNPQSGESPHPLVAENGLLLEENAGPRRQYILAALTNFRYQGDEAVETKINE